MTPGPRVLLVAGLDPSGSAGLLADIQALSEVGARGWAAVAALTAQGQGKPRGIFPVTPAFLLDQLDALLDGEERPRAVKTGALGTAELARALAARLARSPVSQTPLVVDPVLASTAGAPLLDAQGSSPGEALAPLFERALVVTPNLMELALLTADDVSTDEAAVRAARRLPARAVLVKGGHRDGGPVDLLVEGHRVTRFAGQRRPGTARGTGCRLAAAMAGLLAQGASLEEAILGAKRLVERYLDSIVAGPS